MWVFFTLVFKYVEMHLLCAMTVKSVHIIVIWTGDQYILAKRGASHMTQRHRYYGN
jgi:hypothetical protein